MTTLFFVNGALFAGWVTRVPDIRDRVGAGAAELGLALLGVAVGSLLTMPVAGWACARWGGRWIAVGGGLAGCAAIPLPALAHDVPQLACALMVVGAAFGMLDVAMNVEAIAVERAYRRPIMPSFHGWFSTGGLAGALAGGGIASAAVATGPHLGATGVVGAAAVAWASRHLRPAGEVEPSATPMRAGERARPREVAGTRGAARTLGTPVLLICGLIAFCAAVGEGAMADWSALYLTDTLDAGAGIAAMGYAAFAGAMAVGRFAGGRAIAAFGPAGTLQLGCGAAALALTAGLAAADRATTIAAFAVAGLGVACVFPVVLSLAGRAEPGRSGPAVAFVSTIGYTGFLAGPPLIGFVAEQTTLGWGLGVVALLAAVAAALSVALRPETYRGSDPL
ncbi:MAG TPA: MFS transporter [Solirubrobacteraceae bacterium]|nr:MFS transporter [Solirubrobacteraceae bacterium]